MASEKGQPQVWRRLVTSGLLVALASSIAGCTSPQPSQLNEPAVEWEEPAQFAGDPFVEAVRASETQLTLALFYGDYSDPDLIAAVGYADAVVQSRRARWRFSPERGARDGELRFEQAYAHTSAVTSVDVVIPGEFAVVHTCTEGILDESNSGGRGIDWWVWRADSGSLHAAPTTAYMEDSAVERWELCGPMEPERAQWVEPLDLADVDRDSIRRPLDRSVYIGLGVIDE